MVRSLLCLTLSAALIGCTASGRIGDLPTIRSGEASSHLVLIRLDTIVAATNSYYIALNGEEIFSIRSGQYTEFDIPVGEHLVSVKCFGGFTPTWKEDAKRVDAVADQTYYFLISPRLSCAEIEPITPDIAKEHIAESEFISPGTSAKK